MTGGFGSGRRGEVTEFDAHAGLGTIRSDDGTEFHFHCVEIADGSRSIEVGTAVTFDVLPKFGRYEATNVGP